jgi:chromosome partitioning protein
MFDRKTVHSREVLERINEAFPKKVCDTTIARTVRFPETTVAGEPITSYASSSAGAASYRRLARELIANGGIR